MGDVAGNRSFEPIHLCSPDWASLMSLLTCVTKCIVPLADRAVFLDSSLPLLIAVGRNRKYRWFKNSKDLVRLVLCLFI